MVDAAKTTTNIDGSVAISGDRLSWPLETIIEEKDTHGKYRHKPALSLTDLAAVTEVSYLPFLGVLIHADLVKSIGLPEKGFFIAGDDVEYCFRAKEFGAKLFVAAASVLEHPAAVDYVVPFLWRKVVCLRQPPWKRYYDTRNRLLIGKKYYGLHYYYKTLPGPFVRMVAALVYEPDRMAQSWAFFAGFIDGVLGKQGKRHHLWGINL